MQPAKQMQYVPSFDGKSSSFLDYGQRVRVWNGSTDIPPEKRSALVILHMDATARRVCLFSGGDTLMEGGDVMRVVQTARGYFQPDAIDRVVTQVGKFTSYVRTDQPIKKFLMECGILRRKAEKRMFPAGEGFPNLYISFSRIRAA